MSKLIYYRDFKFEELCYNKAIKSHLGTMQKYSTRESQGLRIQFPKVKILGVVDNVVTLDFQGNAKGFEFFEKLKEMNVSKIKKKTLVPFNWDSTRISMKVNENTLYFTEDSCITSLDNIERNLETCKVVVIASSEGLWCSEQSFGNTWVVEQMKLYLPR